MGTLIEKIDDTFQEGIEQAIENNRSKAHENLVWLKNHMPQCFFIGNQEEVHSIANLANGISALKKQNSITLYDQDHLLMLAQRKEQGSMHETVCQYPDREASYVQIMSSDAKMLDTMYTLEVLRFFQDEQKDHESEESGVKSIPVDTFNAIESELKKDHPDFDPEKLKTILGFLWMGNEKYVRFSPPERVVRSIVLYDKTVEHGGILFSEEAAIGEKGEHESRIMFGVGNPPRKNFLPQILEVFKRLQLPVKRAHFLTVSNGTIPYLLCTVYIDASNGDRVSKGTAQYDKLNEELYNTQLLSKILPSYELVTAGVVTGPEATLINAFIGFCLANLAHANPNNMTIEDIRRAFLNHPDVSLQLIKLFKARFDPNAENRETVYDKLLSETSHMVENYNTGRGFIDEFRRDIFRCCLLFIRFTLKTNYFIPEKHALAFRLDPAYLNQLEKHFTANLPAERPFRVTYFFGRFGSGFHIGFSDIARGGWRTLIARNRDDYAQKANTMFKENYVLAHTQHLKNKDIYEGGSKMVALLDAGGEEEAEAVNQRLHRLQYGFISAFFDIYVTENGRPKNPMIVDYYGEDEPIELGPDENMHDVTVELIAKKAVRRGYMLGTGIMSSKEVGINHKEYGVTSIGVIRFAEVAMKNSGIDMHKDPFSVKFTGGPNGDVAGNGMRLILERCPQAAINLIVDGTGAICDLKGLNRSALEKIILKSDLDAFDVSALNPGGFLIYHNQRKKDGVRELFRKVTMTESGLVEDWISNDEFYKEYNDLMFSVPADLFIPAGGRPETVHMDNCHKFLDENGKANTKIIAEGANSFITPDARVELQENGVVVMRDASANKCGVISSSYEIIANLMMSDEEFLANKAQYVNDVIDILNKRAEDEANLIFRRFEQAKGAMLYTQVSDEISQEINKHYAQLFDFFQSQSDLVSNDLYRKTILRHLPVILADNEEFSSRIKSLPPKIISAILASETASSMVYSFEDGNDFKQVVENHLRRIVL